MAMCLASDRERSPVRHCSPETLAAVLELPTRYRLRIPMHCRRTASVYAGHDLPEVWTLADMRLQLRVDLLPCGLGERFDVVSLDFEFGHSRPS